MKTAFSFLICLFCFYVNAQDVTLTVNQTNFYYQSFSANEHQFTFETFFSCGYAATCPPFVGSTIYIENDILYVKAYYDIRGAWPQVGCHRTNIVNYNEVITSNIEQVIMSTNVITTSFDNIDESITIDDVYVQIFDAALSTAQNNFRYSSTVLYPIPTQNELNLVSNFEYDQIAIVDQLGKTIKILNGKISKTIDVQFLKSGVYYLNFYLNNEMKNIAKFIKKN